MLAQQTLDFLRSGKLIAPGQHIVAAVSGGRDSCVMLHILWALREKLECKLSVAHFDHGLREVSREEQEFVAQLAADYGLPFYRGAAQVEVEAKGANIEDTARKLRYAFLRQTAAQVGAELIATAHHGQDQAETLLLHLLRGSGLEGLAAISPLEQGLLRPLLFARPEQIEEYRAAHDIAFRQDESNMDTRFLRNHLRLNILPQLQAINPGLLKAFSATADICREDNALLEELAAEAEANLYRPETGYVQDGLYKLAPALQRRVLRRAVTEFTGQVLTYEQTCAALGLREEQSLTIGGAWLICRRCGLHITSEPLPPLPNHEELIPLHADGMWHQLADWGWEYRGERTEDRGQRIDELVFRTRRDGDFVASSGKSGRRKLKEIFIDAKIPPYDRACWPLLLFREEIIWVPGLYKRGMEPVADEICLVVRKIVK